MRFSKTELQSTTGECLRDLGYRKLWCATIRDSFYRATLGEGTSLLFFKTQGGHFTRLCEFLELPEADIRKQVLANGSSNLDRKRIYKNVGLRRNDNGN